MSRAFSFAGLKSPAMAMRRVVGGVELLVEVANVGDARGFDVGVRADDVGVVGMCLGEEEVVYLFVGDVVGAAFALAALVADDVALVGELVAVEAFEQEAHAVALQPQSELELVRRHGLEVVGAVEAGGAVDVGGSGALNELDVSLLADVLGALEHHVFEEMGEAGAAGALVERADVVPEVDGDEREAMVFVGDDDETVGHGELLELELRELEGRGWRERLRGARVEENADCERQGKEYGESCAGYSLGRSRRDGFASFVS